MNTHRKNKGFTLIELLVVISILALLAALVIPKAQDVYERSRSATQAYSLGDIQHQLEIFYAMNKKYPDGLDTLVDTDGNRYARLNAGATQYFAAGLHNLSDEQITSLNSAGIGHCFLHDPASSDYSNSGVERRHFGDGTGHDGTANIRDIVVVDKTLGSDGLNLLVNDFGLNPNRSTGDTALPRISNHIYVVFGLGNKSTIVQKQIAGAPILEHARSDREYSRALLVYEVPLTGGDKANLVGAIGPDGRAKGLALTQYVTGEVPH